MFGSPIERWARLMSSNTTCLIGWTKTRGCIARFSKRYRSCTAWNGFYFRSFHAMQAVALTSGTQPPQPIKVELMWPRRRPRPRQREGHRGARDAVATARRSWCGRSGVEVAVSRRSRGDTAVHEMQLRQHDSAEVTRGALAARRIRLRRSWRP